MSAWFFAPPEAWGETAISLPPDESHHALRVLRLAPPDVVGVTDGLGTVATCAIGEAAGGALTVEILDRDERPRPKPQIVIYQGAAKGHKLDDAVDRLAELGAAELVSFTSRRSVVSWDDAKVAKLESRWSAIARSASKQSRNPFLLKATAGVTWPALLERVAAEPLALTLWEEASLPLRAALSATADRVAIVIGPEGGFTKDEAESLADAGAPLVSLGPRILRTELAPVVATAALSFHYGLIG